MVQSMTVLLRKDFLLTHVCVTWHFSSIFKRYFEVLKAMTFITEKIGQNYLHQIKLIAECALCIVSFSSSLRASWSQMFDFLKEMLVMCQKTLPRGLKQAGETPTDPSHNKDAGSCETVGVQGVPGSSVRLFLNFTVALCLLYKWLALKLHSLRLAQACCHQVINGTPVLLRR